MERKKKKALTPVPTAQRLRQARRALPLGQIIFGRPLGLSQNKMSALEKRDDMTKVIALAIEHIYGIQADWLLTGTEPRYTAEGPRMSGGTEDGAFDEALSKHPDVMEVLQELLGLTVTKDPPKTRGRKRKQ
ncbi:MAG: helix-turn-helix transcriptional regulator [Deltaproteobacteria bacterium]|nr:helix-turn-helix transcriptional regulator [Deltaproteobacteria bacterium]